MTRPWWLACVGVLVGCGGPAVIARPAETATPRCSTGFDHRSSLALDRTDLAAQGASPRLLAKLDRSAYKYFRMLAPAMASRTCWTFRDLRWHLPVVAVHGDAHVEQFVVTGGSFGLEDYDQAGFGPAVVDLVRYVASLHMLCREVSWACDADRAAAAYFRAYRDALDRPPEPHEPPAIAERLRTSVPQDAASWLAWADSLMQPLPSAQDALARRGLSRLAVPLAAARPDRPASYYDIVRVGGLEIGLGSALEKKVLFRIRGPTDAPDDDVILEGRRTTLPRPDDCVWRPAHGGSLQALMFMSLLGPRMPEVFGFGQIDVGIDAPEAWVQSWDRGYRELRIDDIQSQAELDELAESAAAQLAGHFWTRFPEPLRPLQRRAQLDAFDAVRDRALATARELADETVAEWTRFRGGPPPVSSRSGSASRAP